MDGVIAETAIPATIRLDTDMVKFVAQAVARLAAANTTSPQQIERRRPCLSLSLPINGEVSA
ncbi:hypothetical protein WL76_25360 [Burkholderia ubonensis]|nr:hypothetical protein WL76_25360 [Burkholderia ubonensis]